MQKQSIGNLVVAVMNHATVVLAVSSAHRQSWDPQGVRVRACMRVAVVLFFPKCGKMFLSVNDSLQRQIPGPEGMHHQHMMWCTGRGTQNRVQSCCNDTSNGCNAVPHCVALHSSKREQGGRGRRSRGKHQTRQLGSSFQWLNVPWNSSSSCR